MSSVTFGSSFAGAKLRVKRFASKLMVGHGGWEAKVRYK